MKFNRLTSDRIHAGRHLMIPVWPGAANGSSTGASMHARLNGAAGRAGSTESIHVVRRGDSLWAIARRYDVSVSQLAGWNGISVKSVLRPGQRLTVYRRNPGAVRTGLPEITATRSSEAAPPVFHVVRRGDTLSEIAQRHGTTVLRLAEYNQIGQRSILRPGQKLRVSTSASSTSSSLTDTRRNHERVRYRVKRGDSLWDISRQFGVSIASLREWNRISKGELLIPGRELDVHLERTPSI